MGRFNSWRILNYPGINEYQGLLRHMLNWNPSFDPTDKRVAVIGNGASGLQFVPNIQPLVARLDHYARSKTWIAALWTGDERVIGPQYFSKDEQELIDDL